MKISEVLLIPIKHAYAGHRQLSSTPINLAQAQRRVSPASRFLYRLPRVVPAFRTSPFLSRRQTALPGSGWPLRSRCSGGRVLTPCASGPPRPSRASAQTDAGNWPPDSGGFKPFHSPPRRRHGRPCARPPPRRCVPFHSLNRRRQVWRDARLSCRLLQSPEVSPHASLARFADMVGEQTPSSVFRSFRFWCSSSVCRPSRPRRKHQPASRGPL